MKIQYQDYGVVANIVITSTPSGKSRDVLRAHKTIQREAGR